MLPFVSEATEDADGVHQPAAERAGAALRPAEVPDAGRPRRHRLHAAPVRRAGHHLVPEQARQVETRPGGAQGGRGGRQGARHGAVDGRAGPTGGADAGQPPSALRHIGVNHDSACRLVEEGRR